MFSKILHSMLVVRYTCMWQWSVLQFGRRVYVSGQIGLNPATMMLVDDDAVMQSRLSLRHVGRVLAAVSSSRCLYNLLMVVCYATSCDAAVAAQTEFNNATVSSLDISHVSTNYCHCLWLLFAKTHCYFHI